MTNTENTTDIIPNVILNPVNGKKIPTVSSLQVAEIFGKRHDNVLRDIEYILTQLPEIFVELNFEEYEESYRAGFDAST